MTEYRYPYAGHPDGESHLAWYRVADGHGYSTDDNPAGASDAPCFAVIDGRAYPNESEQSIETTFQIIGSFAYASQGAAWFHIRRTAQR